MSNSPSYYQKKVLDGNRTAFMFDTLIDYNRFISEISAKAPNNSNSGMGIQQTNDLSYIRRRSSDANWYGTTNVNLITGNIDEFLFNDDLNRYIENVRDKSVKVDIIDIDQQKAIKFTEKEIGIFSFDLASLGLIPVYEFYSPLLKTIVSGNLVRSVKNAQGQDIFYHIEQPAIPEHEVKYNASLNGYFSPILNRVIDRSELIEVVRENMPTIYLYPTKEEIPQHDVERRNKLDESGNRKFSTTFKKSFIEIPKIEKPLPRIDIIVGSSFSSRIKAQTEMIYNSMSAIALAEKLSKAGVNFRLIACYPQTTSGSQRKDVFGFVTIKKEGQTFDKNNTAVLLSDGRNTRYNSFKGWMSMFYDSGYDAYVNAGTIGYPINDADRIKNAYMDFLALSDNPEDVKASLNPSSKIVVTGAFSEQQAVDQYNSIIEQISNLAP